MKAHYFIQGLFMVAGIISTLAALFNWEWFFKARNAQLIVRNAGRSRARLFYGVLGGIMMGMALFFFFETP